MAVTTVGFFFFWFKTVHGFNDLSFFHWKEYANKHWHVFVMYLTALTTFLNTQSNNDNFLIIVIVIVASNYHNDNMVIIVKMMVRSYFLLHQLQTQLLQRYTPWCVGYFYTYIATWWLVICVDPAVPSQHVWGMILGSSTFLARTWIHRGLWAHLRIWEKT